MEKQQKTEKGVNKMDLVFTVFENDELRKRFRGNKPEIEKRTIHAVVTLDDEPTLMEFAKRGIIIAMQAKYRLLGDAKIMEIAKSGVQTWTLSELAKPSVASRDPMTTVRRVIPKMNDTEITELYRELQKRIKAK